MSKIVRRISTAVSCLESGLMVVLIWTALVVGLMQILLRYLLNTGFPWSEGIVTVLVIWSALIGSSRAMQLKLHIRLDVLETVVPANVYWVLECAAGFVCLLYALFVTWAGAVFISFLVGTGAKSIASGLPLWGIYLIVPISMVLFGYRTLERLVHVLRKDGYDLRDRELQL